MRSETPSAEIMGVRQGHSLTARSRDPPGPRASQLYQPLPTAAFVSVSNTPAVVDLLRPVTEQKSEEIQNLEPSQHAWQIMRSTAAQPHVAFIAFPFGSHPSAIFPVARAVAIAAPDAVVSFIATSRALTSLPRVDGTPNLRLVAVADGVPHGSLPPENVLQQIGKFLAATPGNLKDSIAAATEAAGGVAVSCISSDAFLWMSGEVAEGLVVQWVPLWAGGTAALVAHLHTDVLRQKIGVGEQAIAGREKELLECIPGLAVHQICDLPEGILSGDLEAPFSVLLHRMAQKLPKSAAVILNTFQGLDPAIDASLTSILPRYLPLGPFHILSPAAAPVLDPDGCLAWLDHHAPSVVAYVSFGLIMTPPPGELSQLAEGLEASGVPFIWSLKEEAQGCLPPGFLDRTAGQGMVVSWAPQLAVLDHPAVGVFLTHAGWNSVMEGIAAGVPMVCRPIFGDHRLIARSMTEEWRNGMGFKGEAMTKEGMVSVLEKMMNGEEGRRVKMRARELKEAAINSVGPGGSSRKNLESLLELMLGSKAGN